MLSIIVFSSDHCIAPAASYSSDVEVQIYYYSLYSGNSIPFDSSFNTMINGTPISSRNFAVASNTSINITVTDFFNQVLYSGTMKIVNPTFIKITIPIAWYVFKNEFDQAVIVNITKNNQTNAFAMAGISEICLSNGTYLCTVQDTSGNILMRFSLTIPCSSSGTAFGPSPPPPPPPPIPTDYNVVFTAFVMGTMIFILSIFFYAAYTGKKGAWQSRKMTLSIYIRKNMTVDELDRLLSEKRKKALDFINAVDD